MEWRLVDSDLQEPAYTAAADEAMARARASGTAPSTLHFYRRDRPTISLGYFQRVEETVDLELCRANGISIVRRASGGSAIYTDPGHLIYGLALGEGELPRDREESFRLVCGGIVLALELLGIEAEFKPVNDVLVDGRKISGSAQLRRQGVVLQHGTLVLDNDPDMMAGALRMDTDKLRQRGHGPRDYVVSLREVLGREPDLALVKDALARGLGWVLGADWHVSEFTPWEKEEIRRLVAEKYGKEEWNMSR